MHKLTIRGSKIFIDNLELTPVTSYILNYESQQVTTLAVTLQINPNSLSVDLSANDIGDNTDINLLNE